MNMEFSEFTFNDNVYGLCRTENLEKITKFNLIMNGKSTNNIKYIDNILNNNITKQFDIVICNCFNVDKAYIDYCIEFIEDGGKGVLIINNDILYNNGINKNAPLFPKALALTWEYKLRKKLIDEFDVCKIIFPDWEKDYCIILFNKNKTEQSYVDFCKYNNNDDEYTTIKSVNKKDIVQKYYCLNYVAYDGIKKIQYTDVENLNFTQSKILECIINKKNISRLNYRSILMHIYNILGDKKIIKKNTRLNIEYGEYTNKGYKYIENLDISLQGTDSNMTIKEILNQCKKNKIKIHMKIVMNDGKEIIL
jgi:hypothetical protein